MHNKIYPGKWRDDAITDKEFKRLTRYQLIDIIYQLQLKQDELTAENQRLNDELADKRLRIGKAGNIAEAALEVHRIMQSAQDAADLYLEEIRIMREETEAECRRLLEQARQEADAITAQAKKAQAAPRPKSSGAKKHKKRK